mgnify:CR=1 FL=1
MTEPPVERRFQRVPFDGDVRVYTGSAMAGTRLIDISLKGALVDRPAGWEAKPGQIQRLELRVGSGVIAAEISWSYHQGLRRQACTLPLTHCQ